MREILSQRPPSKASTLTHVYPTEWGLAPTNTQAGLRADGTRGGRGSIHAHGCGRVPDKRSRSKSPDSITCDARMHHSRWRKEQ